MASINNLDELKKEVFYSLMDIAGRVFIVIEFGDDVLIGRRGFLPEEKEKGLILVFNNRMKFTWDDYGISTTLVFGQSPEKCFIPQQRIVSVFSPELNVQFSAAPQKQPEEGPKPQQPMKEKAHPSKDEKVIKVEFGKKR